MLALVVFQALAWLQAEERQHQARERVVEHAAGLRARLDTGLSSTLYLANGLVALIRGVDAPTPAQFRGALRALHDADPRVRNIGLAPGNRITYIHPLQGNEEAIGLRFDQQPDQWPGVQRAMESRSSVVVGPVNLVQGGRGIINRTPVFLENGDYWGLISIVVDIERLLDYVGLAPEVDGIRYWLLGNAEPSGQRGRLVGDGDGEVPADAVTMPISLPGASWQLRAIPADGWRPPPAYVWAWRLGGLILAVLVSWVVWLLIRAGQRHRAMAAAMQRLNDELVMKNTELTQLSRHDGLTGLSNRRHFDDVYAKAWARAWRQRRAIHVLIIDFDNFKAVNDRYGHVAGDACLVGGAAAIRRAVGRGEDLVARSGGEEFAVVIENADTAAVDLLAERIRREIAAAVIDVPGQLEPLSLTASIGVAGAVPMGPDGGTDLYREADGALYRAKRDGRNRVRWADSRG